MSSLEATDILAIVLSIVTPGLGHIILGQPLKGIVILAAVLGSCGVGYVICALVAIDAYLVAKVRKEREVGPWEVFPEHRSYAGA
jgi:TM2 domain-containing membrane protein YozV